MAFNVSWFGHLTNSKFYGNLLKGSVKISVSRLNLPGHCVKHPQEIASVFILRQPSKGRPNRWRKRTTYVENLTKDNNMKRVEELRSLMLDRYTWREVVKNCCGGSDWYPV